MKKVKNKSGSNYEMPTGKVRIIKDFLPPPEELAKAKVIVKVTIGLDLSTVQFFQGQARKHKTKYQRMIREVLDRYASGYRAA